MRVFVNNVFISEENIEYIELVLHDEKTLSNSFMLSSYEACEKFCREKRDEGWIIYPLKNDSLELNPRFHRITRIPKDSKIMPYLKQEDSLLSIYSLYWDLAYYNAVFLDEEYNYPNNYIGYLSEFSNINIHKDSMCISMPVIMNDSVVCSRDLVSQDPNPKHYSFMVAVPKEHVSKFYKYKLIEGDELVLNNKTFIVMKYEQNLSLYRCLSDFKFSEAVTVYYGSMCRKYELLLELSKYALSTLSAPVDGVVDSFEREGLSSSSLFNSSSGVFINHVDLFPDKESIIKAYSLINTTYKAFVDNKVKNINSKEGIKNLVSHYGLHKDFILSMTIMLNAMLKSGSNEVGLIDSLTNLYRDSKLKILECEMYLYNIRTSCIVNPSSLDYQNGKMMFYIKGPGNTMRMEVW